jgi:peptide methionine sulfoxide reductase MsrA
MASLQDASPWRLASVRDADLGRISYPEDYHQQYLAKNRDGNCGIKGHGIACSIPKDHALPKRSQFDSGKMQ